MSARRWRSGCGATGSLGRRRLRRADLGGLRDEPDQVRARRPASTGRATRDGRARGPAGARRSFVSDLEPLRAVACGAEHRAFLAVSGLLYCCGRNQHGQLGLGDRTSRGEPTLVPIPTAAADGAQTVRAVACGARHTVAVTAAGRLYAWGDAACTGTGAAVDGPPSSTASPTTERAAAVVRPTPVTLPDAADVRIGRVACGTSHTVAVSVGADACFVWGYGPACGDESVPTPRSIGAGSMLQGRRLVSLACGAAHSVAVTRGDGGAGGVLGDTDVWTWGHGGAGQLGHGDLQNRRDPKRLSALSGTGVYAVVAGELHSLALTTTSDVYCWGANSDGQLGLVSAQGFCTVQAVPHLRGHVIAGMAAGAGHSLFLADTGAAQPWRILLCGRTSSKFVVDLSADLQPCVSPPRCFIRSSIGFVTALAARANQSAAIVVGSTTHGIRLPPPRLPKLRVH